MMITTLGIGAYMILLPLMGWVADKIGHVSLMKTISIAALPLGFLMFYFLNTKRFDLFVYVEIIAAFILAAFMAPATFVMTQLFPIQVRYTGTSLGYNIGACVFGGITPIIFTSLIKKTESLISPAFYLSVCVSLGILSAYLYQQISSINLRPRRG